jgi:hypothetical protein
MHMPNSVSRLADCSQNVAIWIQLDDPVSGEFVIHAATGV